MVGHSPPLKFSSAFRHCGIRLVVGHLFIWPFQRPETPAAIYGESPARACVWPPGSSSACKPLFLATPGRESRGRTSQHLEAVWSIHGAGGCVDEGPRVAMWGTDSEPPPLSDSQRQVVSCGKETRSAPCVCSGYRRGPGTPHL